ncbi:MAG: DegT/DnrJ/EryC1/StrS family aminotransferase [Actinobacteria bacterium]|nr:DegT/DnrJ/EryC1/StrS family aminotransferase [Actinomycetota bacterium]
MPGYELIGAEEQAEVDDIFQHGGVLFRHSFDAIRQDRWKVRDFERAFAKSLGVPHALAVTSGTAALRVALAVLDLQPGDEVITQSFTFVATVEAIIESGATPVCADIDGTLNLDPKSLAKLITPKTRAVIAVHMLGTPADLFAIDKICRDNKIVLLEDAAWGCGGSLDQRPLGTWGRMGTFSFDFAKTMTTGEGGMVVFQNEADYKAAAAWHDHGHENNPAVPRWEDTRASSGFNFRMTEMQGAVGLAQLKKLSSVVTAQRKNRDSMWATIKDLPGITPREAPAGSYETADALVFGVESGSTAKKCREALVEEGLSTKILPEAVTWHFAGTWTHMPELVARHGGDLSTQFQDSRKRLERAVSLPVVVKMDETVPARLHKALKKVLDR